MDVYAGVDLAWSTRARTGLAAVDDDGRLLDSGSALTDDEIIRWLDRGEWNHVVAAVDAPLIVTNPTGQRHCEREVSRVFGRYGASCHASNLTRPYFNPPRGAVLAERLGWSLDPESARTSRRPVCIEVYPHPAIVGLFELGSILPYKSKGGRSFRTRHAAMLDLMDHMESLDPLQLSSSARWREIRVATDAATRPVELDRLEDEVDAIFCAHLGWRWRHRPESMHMYGTVTDGYIVATPPPTHAVGTAAATRAESRSADEPHTEFPVAAAMVAFEVDGVPATFATAGERPWRAAVYEASSAAVGDGGPLPGRLEVTVHFRLPVASRKGQGWNLDNLVAPTLDALTPVLGKRAIAGPEQADGERIDRLVASKRTVREDEEPGATVLVTVL
jgi:predicted RNase H-like nuclease